MASSIRFEVKGLDKVLANLEKFDNVINKYIQQAALESVRIVLNTEGIRKYPPATNANRPPIPYYERGRGMWVHRGRGENRMAYNLNNSETYGKKWVTRGIPYGARAGNSASYAHFLVGDDQAKAMGKIGWRKISEVVQEKIPQITEIFQGWVNKLIEDLHLE